MIIVAANGQAGSGKSFLMDATAEALKLGAGPSHPAGVRVARKSLKQPLRDALMNFIREYVNPRMGDSEADYAAAKNMDIGGITGRQFMIAMGNAMRGAAPAFLPNLLLSKLGDYVSSKPLIVLIDDLGFAPELERFKAEPGVRVITVYCESYAVANSPGAMVYAHGEQYNGDSRMCLRGDADLLDPPVAVLYDAIVAALVDSSAA